MANEIETLELSKKEVGKLFQFLLQEYAKDENFDGFNIEIDVDFTGRYFNHLDEFVNISIKNLNNNATVDITDNSEYEDVESSSGE